MSSSSPRRSDAKSSTHVDVWVLLALALLLVAASCAAYQAGRTSGLEYAAARADRRALSPAPTPALSSPTPSTPQSTGTTPGPDTLNEMLARRPSKLHFEAFDRFMQDPRAQLALAAGKDDDAVVELLRGGGPRVFAFYRESCPHCQRAMPVWQQFPDIVLVNADTCKKAVTVTQLRAVPWVIKVRDGDIAYFDRPHTAEAYADFLQT